MDSRKKKPSIPSSSVGHASPEQLFQKAFDEHADELFRHAFLRMSDRERAVELTQEAFLRVWQYVTKGEQVEHYRSFLYRILNNLIIDEYRKKKTQSLDALLEEEETVSRLEGEVLRDETDLLEEAAIRFDAAEAIAALQELPQQYQAVLVMRYIDELSPKEIGVYMDESENAVSVRIHRGLHKLREILSAKHSHE